MDDDGHKTLICEAHRLSHDTATKLLTVATPQADALLANMEMDNHKNIICGFEVHGTMHTLTVNKRITNRCKYFLNLI